MYLVTSKEMREIDRLAVEKWGIPEIVLMENAGIKVVEEIKNELKDIKGKKITIIVGKGNNGGDGLVIARHLCNLGAEVKVFLYGAKEFKDSSLINYNIAQNLPIKFHKLDDENSLHLLKLSLYYTEIVVDAIVGTGFHGEAQGILEKIINIINDSKSLKVAVDIPTGLDADTGKVKGVCIKADTTVTFALPKIGLTIMPGLDYVGNLKVVDISIPKEIMHELKINKHILTVKEIKENIPIRQQDSHKGSFGHVEIVGGSLGMMGAVHLAALGAFNMGAGLVSAAIPRSIQESLATSLPEMITYPITETSIGTLGAISETEILNSLQNKSVLVLGPGLGKNSESLTLIKGILEKIEIPVVIDADGLNALSDDIDILKNVKPPIILTPHPGEMGRLLKTSTQEVQENRLEFAEMLAAEYGIWIVLKGNRTIIVNPESEIFVNPTGSPALATAGTGDILAGMIGAMLGQQKDITKAICTAVFLHGLAGERVKEEIGEISSKARDVVKAIPKVLEEVLMDDNK